MKLENVIAKRAHKTIYRDGNTAVKVFDENFKKADILNEALNLARVEETSLNIPKLCGVTAIDGKWALITEFAEGETMAELIKKNPGRTEEYLEKFVDLQLKMHNEKVPMLSKLKEKMHGKISASGLDPSIRYELHARLEGMPKHSKLCHGDFNPGNIIVGNDGKMYILDWSHATQGNASTDAARTYLLFALSERPELADMYLDLFCKKSDTARQYVQKWLPIVAASQLVKGKPEERELLLRWANVVEYE